MLQLKEVRSEFVEDCVRIFMTGNTVLIFMTSGFLIYLLQTKSPSSMTAYKHFQTFYVLVGLLFELDGACFKPVQLLGDYGKHVMLFYSVGWLASAPPKTFLILFIVAIACVTEFYICIGSLAMERYWAFTRVFTKFPMLFVFWIVFNVAIFSLLSYTFYAACADGVLLETKEIRELLLERVNGSAAFLVRQPHVFGFAFGRIRLSALIAFAVFLSLLTLTSTTTLFLILYKIRDPLLRHRLGIPQTQNMLLKACLAQFIGFVVFLNIPVMLFWIVAIFMQIQVHVFEAVVLVTTTFMFYETVAIIVIVRPYREAVQHMIHTVRRILRLPGSVKIYDDRAQLNTLPTPSYCV